MTIRPASTRILMLSGPMSDLPEYNRPAFHSAEGLLDPYAKAILNPATLPIGMSYMHYMDIAMAMVRSADILITLDGHEKSRGSQAEQAYAVSLRKPVFPLETFLEAQQYSKHVT